MKRHAMRRFDAKQIVFQTPDHVALEDARRVIADHARLGFATADQRGEPRLHPANYLEATHRLNTAAQHRGHVLANNSGN